jgi:hypothetical protein
MGGDITGELARVRDRSAAKPSDERCIPRRHEATTFSNEDQDGTDANWSVTAYAICVGPPAGLDASS